MKYDHDKAQEIVKLVDPEKEEYEEIQSQLNQYFYVSDYLKELSLVLKDRFTNVDELKQALVAVSEIVYEVIMNDDVGWIDVEAKNGETVLCEVIKGLTNSLDYETSISITGYLQEIYAGEFQN